MPTKDIALRKRQQIAKANRTMFFWVAGASALMGFAMVVSVLLFQKLMFNEKVLAEKATTASILQKNNKVVGELKNQIRVLNTNQALIDSKASSDDEPIQVILDALPSEANSTALGSSLQEKLIKGDGITIESFTTNPIAGVESDDTTPTSTTANTASANEIGFTFTVTSTDVNAFKALLERLERSIRAIDVTNVKLETRGDRYALSIEGHGFYEPAKSVELKDKVIKP